MKAFSLFLVELNEGRTHAGLTSDLADLMQAVMNTGKTGSMTLKIKISSASKGGHEVDKITVMAERKLELPKPDQPHDFFFLTENGEPTRQHPRQHSLDLRDAQDTRGGMRSATEQFTTPDADGVMTLKEAK